MTSLFNSGCAFRGRGAGNRSQHPEITLTVGHLSWLRPGPVCAWRQACGTNLYLPLRPLAPDIRTGALCKVTTTINTPRSPLIPETRRLTKKRVFHRSEKIKHNYTYGLFCIKPSLFNNEGLIWREWVLLDDNVRQKLISIFPEVPLFIAQRRSLKDEKNKSEL